MQQQIAFIGAGNMATSLIRGLLAKDYAPDYIYVADPQSEALAACAKLGVRTHVSNTDAIEHADTIVLAVKPQVAAAALSSMSNLRDDQLLISIMAGIELSSLTSWSHPKQPIVRCMPNTPALFSAGITALFANSFCQAGQKEHAEAILRTAGTALWVDSESTLDVVTAVSGSGPAYFFLLMEAMITAGEALGLSPEVAKQLTVETAMGAATMASQGTDSPATLRQNVTSPGGTTAAALSVMTDADLLDTVQQAVQAAHQRAAKLSKEFGGSGGLGTSSALRSSS